MHKIQIFDPAMCCSNGVCEVEADPSLVTFAADLDWLNAQGAQVERINLAQEPQRFVQHDAIRQLLESEGEGALPAIVVDGELRHSGRYPSREQLAGWARLPSEMSLFTDEVAELVALGAAVASNCESCFKLHFGRARELGVTDADMRRAVDLARQIRETPTRGVQDLTHRYLNMQATSATTGESVARPSGREGACCEPAAGKGLGDSGHCC